MNCVLFFSVGAFLVVAHEDKILRSIPRFSPHRSRVRSTEVNRNPNVAPLKSDYTYRTLYFDQKIDHFGFAQDKTFKNRYLLADQFWNRNGGPIFFYTGNEGDIEWFCKNTGFMWDIAPQFNAMLVFAEHRYYGKSMPFGSDSYKNSSVLNFLSSEQALADFTELISFIKATIPGASKSPVVAFGGSYGGMLSAWFRIKYPNIVVGSLAASAPIWQFKDITPCNAFNDVASATWARVSETCVSNANKGYSTLEEVGANAAGLKFISSTFHLCDPLTSMADVKSFKSFLSDMYVDFAEVDYPYPASFLADLPAWPVKEACKSLLSPLSGKPLLEALAKVTNLYFNYTGAAKCVDWKGEGSTASLGYLGWNYQSCTEMVMPMCSNGTGMFYNMDWDFQAFSDDCFKQFGVRPRQDWVKHQYWGTDLSAASNIIFSNGDLDPWSSGGVTEYISESVVSILIKEGAHHLDLRASNQGDTSYVREARTREINIIKEWLELTP
ncbi:hypothetical protein EGW08_014230 [Elysia chlorotica]|uniref:Lysosomal Pro-X carboxypeptidase n=1 Tax=Elysia chlorotica TaxID=188477 RepID=A0A3S0ZHS9_ELYCH|nr:hypothetical protein EGW08_014230 [Elysia chlorotica]